MMELGIEKMMFSKLVDKPDKRLLAEQNLIHFLEFIENHSKELGCYPILNEKAFEAAMIDVGSLWPFRCTG